MTLDLSCHPFISSCINPNQLVKEGENVVIYTRPDQYTDLNYPGSIPAKVLAVFKACDDCYDYVLEYSDEDLPAGIAQIAQCDVIDISCETQIIGHTITAGTSCDDFSGGFNDHTPNIHFASSTLDINIEEDGCVRIELPGYYYVN